MSTSTQFASLIQDQINNIVDELVELKAQFQSGKYLNWDGELVHAPMSVDHFNSLFEPLNDKLIQLQLQQAEF